MAAIVAALGRLGLPSRTRGIVFARGVALREIAMRALFWDFRRWLGWVALVATAMLGLQVAAEAFTTL